MAGLDRSRTPKRANPPEPAGSLAAPRTPRGAPPPAGKGRPRPTSSTEAARRSPQPTPPPARTGAMVPPTSRHRGGPGRRAAATHLRPWPEPGRRPQREERASSSPRTDNLRHRPAPLAPAACFQIAWSSRGPVFFRCPEIRAPPPSRRAHVTAGRRRAQPGGGSGRPRPLEEGARAGSPLVARECGGTLPHCTAKQAWP